MRGEVMSWRRVIPAGNIERIIDKVIIIILSLLTGFGLGLFFCRNDFQKGADYMQRAYSQGYVVREVVKK
jgi:hypothetical protein